MSPILLRALLLLFLAPATAFARPAAIRSLRILTSSQPSIVISPSTATVGVGGSVRFTATVTGIEGEPVQWTTTAGTISSDGTFVAPLNPGTPQVVASLSGGPVSNTGRVTVNAATVAIDPGQDIQAIVSAAPPGSTFRINAGIHRLQEIHPRTGDTFIGAPGAVLSGARLLTSFTRSGNFYVADGQTQEGVEAGDCEPDFPQCRLPEELFFDDVPLVRVGSLIEVRPGRWYFDYATDRIYFVDDPTGRRVEISVIPTAIVNSADRVTVSGLTVEKYANLSQNGAITAEGRAGWVFARNEVRWTHGLGIRFGPQGRVLGNFVHHNGQLGIGGVGDDVLVEDNEIAFNNTAHFDALWEAGGTKFALTNRLIVRRNFVHHNRGPGLWTDIDNVNVTYEFNTCEDNDQMGIFHEISYAAVIRYNTLRRNGFGHWGWLWGAGILVAASPNVEIFGNTVEGNADGITAVQQNRGSGSLGPHQISNLWVHDNTVVSAQGGSGFVQDIGDQSYFTTRNNRFDWNRYWVSGGANFSWMDSEISEAQWRNYGQEQHGVFIRTP